jgi:hypothetical protein
MAAGVVLAVVWRLTGGGTFFARKGWEALK